MISDTPFVEYLIIGAHTSTWLAILGMYVFNIQPIEITRFPAGLLVVAIPFVYLIGMVFDSLVNQLFLDRVRKGIKESVKGADRPDELIAYESGRLYKAYDARVQRVRIVGAAVPNWLILGGLLIIYSEWVDSSRGWLNERTYLIGGVAASLAIVSIFSMRYLYRRAFKYRSTAISVIEAHVTSLVTIRS